MSERLKSVDDLVAFLEKGGVPHQVDKANGIVQVATRPPALPLPVIVRFESKIPYINIIQQMSKPIPDERVREVESAISHVNDVAMIPGYGYSYANKVAYYRLAIPFYDGEITADSLDKAITAVLNNAKQLAGALEKVIEGAPGADILSSLAPH
jgi:hypothetical protein